MDVHRSARPSTRLRRWLHCEVPRAGSEVSRRAAEPVRAAPNHQENPHDPPLQRARARAREPRSRKLSGFEFYRMPMSSRGRAERLDDPLELNMTSIEAGAEWLELKMDAGHSETLRIVYGGIAATMLDFGMARTVHSTLRATDQFVTVELKVNYAGLCAPRARFPLPERPSCTWAATPASRTARLTVSTDNSRLTPRQPASSAGPGPGERP